MPRLAAVLLGLVVAELVAGLVGPAAVPQRLPLPYDEEGALDRLATGQSRLLFDGPLGWVPTPDRASADGVYRHNRDGLRAEREYGRPAPAAGPRVAAYGDSFTYCDEVRFADCWTARLETVLPGSEVLNFGVPGYGPDQAWLRYQRDGATWQPCAVVIGHMPENVNRVVNRFRPFYQPKDSIWLTKPRYVLEDGRPRLLANPARRPEDLKDPGWVETNAGPRDAWYFPGTFIASPLDQLEMVSLARTALYRRARPGPEGWTSERAAEAYRPGSETLAVLSAILTGFADQVRADGATPIVLIFPTKSEVETQHDGRPKAHAPLLEALRAHGVPTIDLTDAFADEARRARLDTLIGQHPRAAGHALAARTLAEALPRLAERTCGSFTP